MVLQRNLTELDLRVVVLVGRHDFGRCPLAASRPPALWAVAEKPVLLRLLEHLAHEGLERAAVCCDKARADLVKSVCEKAPLDTTVIEEDLTKGTGGCLRDAAGDNPGDLLVAISGSMSAPPALAPLVEAHRAGDAELTMVFNPDGADEMGYGCPAEIYLCNPTVLQHIPIGGYSDIKEGMIPSILRAGGKVQPHVLPEDAGNFSDRSGYLHAIGRYLSAGDGLVRSAGGRVAETASSAVIHPTARICGPVAIGEQAQVQQGAVVVGPTVVGSHAVVGVGSTVVGSVLWEGARVGDRCEITDSVVAQDVVVPNGTEILEQTVADGGRRLAVSSYAETVPDARAGRTGYVVGGLVVTLALLWSYWSTVVGLWRVWRGSDEFSAGLLVPVLALYVIWTRRDEFVSVAIKPALLAGTAMFALAQALRWFGLHRMYTSAERLSLVVSIAALVLLLLGWRWFRKLSPMLLFLLLMLPYPNAIQQKIGLPLQNMATNSAVFCLELVGTDVQKDGNVIGIGNTRVEVATACNGLRMIMAFFIVSGLVVLLAKRAWWEKLVVVVSSLPIALFCNTVRLTVTSLLFTVIHGQWLEQVSHDFGGYAMMPLALALMVGELWLLSRLTTPPVETAPEIIARRRPRQVPGA